MAKESFLFIPDITGFTEFVRKTEVEHGQHIISELLEVIIDSNEIGLEVSEVEGDAVLFYKHEDVPDFRAVLNQIRKMFIDFHYHIKEYDKKRICQCGACSTAPDLSLKFVVHRGPIGFTKVKERQKPYGAELVKVHKLLKNDIEEEEYALITEDFYRSQNINQVLISNTWLEFHKKTTDYDKMGEITYHHFSLEPLIAAVPDPPDPAYPAKVKDPAGYDLFIEAPMYVVFENVTNLDLRLHWYKGVSELEYEENHVNRVGTKHRCLFEKGFADFETVSNDFGENKLVYGERIERKIIGIKEISIYYIMSETGNGTNLRVEFHIQPRNIIGRIIRGIIIGKTMTTSKEITADLKEICESEAVGGSTDPSPGSSNSSVVQETN